MGTGKRLRLQFKKPETPMGILAAKLTGLFCSMVFLAAGIVLFLKCRLGSDPQTVLYDGMSAFFGISYALAAGIYSWSMFGISFLFARRYFGIGSVVSAFSISFFIGFYEHLFAFVDFASMSFGMRFLLMIAGQIFMCLGMTLSVWTDFGMNCSLAVLYKICDITGVKFKSLKTANDIVFAAAGFLMGGIIGIGTVFSALATGIMISTYRRFLDRYLFPMPKLPDKIFHQCYNGNRREQ